MKVKKASSQWLKTSPKKHEERDVAQAMVGLLRVRGKESPGPAEAHTTKIHEAGVSSNDQLFPSDHWCLATTWMQEP